MSAQKPFEVIVNTMEMYIKNSKDSEYRNQCIKTINTIKNSYVLVQFPESQNYMDEDWFEDEAILNVESSGDYFIPISRII